MDATSSPSVVPAPISAENTVPFAPVALSAIPSSGFSRTPFAFPHSTSVGGEPSNTTDSDDDSQFVSSDRAVTPPPQARVHARVKSNVSVAVPMFDAKCHSMGCSGSPSGNVELEFEYTNLYPTVEIHCRIFTGVLSKFFYSTAASIFNQKDVYPLDSLKNLECFYNSSPCQVYPSQLCCREQIKSIYWFLIVMSSNPITAAKYLKKRARVYYSDDSIYKEFQRISEYIKGEYKKEGFEFFYFCFINTKHPFHQAVISAIPLNSTTFELCSTSKSLDCSRKFNDELKKVSGRNSLCKLVSESHHWNRGKWDHVGFSKRKLVDVIRKTALKGVGVSVLNKKEEDEQLKNVLTLSLITNNPLHKDVILPGLRLSVADSIELKKLRSEENWDEYNFMRQWGSTTTVSKVWLEHVYRMVCRSTWTIPKCIVARQNPETLDYVCKEFINVPNVTIENWNMSVFKNVDNPNRVHRNPELKSTSIEWLLGTDGRYIPILNLYESYRICGPYDCSIEKLRARICNQDYLKQLSSEAMLYLLSEFLNRGLTVKELAMDRESIISSLMRCALYGNCDISVPYEVEERD